MKGEKAFIVIMLLGGLIWPISALAGIPIWQDMPYNLVWWGCFIKWLIVCALAAVPVVALRIGELTPRRLNITGYFIYFILGANILWTLPAPHKDHVVRIVNKAIGAALVIGLVIHIAALRRHGRDLYEVRRHPGSSKIRFVYGNGTPLSWLFCYTVWNFTFLMEISTGTTLQTILFWVGMCGYKWIDPDPQPIELYFGFARPVNLGVFIVVSETLGTFVPFFREAPTLREHSPLPLNSHPYFFFIVVVNFVWSIVCIGITIGEYTKGFRKDEFRLPAEESEDSDDSDDSGLLSS